MISASAARRFPPASNPPIAACGLSYNGTMDRTPSAQPEEDAFGIDLDRLRENLRLTPEERVRRIERASNELLRFLDEVAESRRQNPRSDAR